VTRVDLDGIQYRILDMPIPPGQLSSLQVGESGQLYFLQQNGDDTSLQHFDLKKRKVETAAAGVAGYVVSGDGKKILYGAQPAPGEPVEQYFIVSTEGKIEPGQGKLNIDAVQVRVDPRVEWPAMFDEAWRVSRDFFYAPNMHGVDWAAMKKKYSVFLPELSTRGDLNRVLQWLGSELVVGHNYITNPGDNPLSAKTVPGGLLGADYEVANGRYRFKKVFGGLNFNPQLRSPLTEPGVNVRAGEYLLAVRGQDLRPPASVYSLFENTAGKSIDITVGPNADGSGSRAVTVVPIANEAAIRNRDWIEGNIKKVDAATDGRVAYVYVPDTAQGGHEYFKRYFFPQAYKDAIIIDERFNSGGLAADYVIDILKRPFISNWANRYGADQKLPMGSIQGPKVMIIDETAGSGGDLLPWMFRKEKLGTIVGKRTWGGLVGIGGYPALIDGGTVTAPNFAIWTPGEGWVVENIGVAPDIEVEQKPNEVISGHDPQLERAIAVVLEQLKQNPPKPSAHPAYPVKIGRGGGPGR
jgi:tricorn protease